jgi:nucleotide-binding universal stress UspA family protein
MTTHGRSGFKRAIFGSVAEEVLRSAAVPVLVIRKPAPVPAPAEAVR